jgi:o-succinylbenzoate---CoA ligase
MFLRDAHRTVTFEQLHEQALMLRSERTSLDSKRDTDPPAAASVNRAASSHALSDGTTSHATTDATTIHTFVDLETATSIAVRYLANLPSILVPTTSPFPHLFPPSSPNPSLSASLPRSILNPQSLVLLSTSGSTGRPKWVAYTRNHILAAAAASEAAMRPSSGSAWLLNLPLHHAGGLGILLRSLVWGTSVHVIDRRDATSIVETLEAYPDIDTLSLVPSQLHDILELVGPDRLRHLRNILIGAGSLSERDLDIVNRHKLPVRQSYGMTETLGHFCLTSRACEASIGFRTCGRPLPKNELKVVGDDGQTLSDGRIGHIWIRGPQVIADYAEPDPSKFIDGWFHTGDYGYIENDELIFVARRTDMIKSGGENVIAVRVESVLKELPYIADCAVIGIDDPRWGQRVHACISVQTDADINIESLRNDLRNTLLPFEIPRSLSIHESIPRNAMGKLQRELLIVENPDII